MTLLDFFTYCSGPFYMFITISLVIGLVFLVWYTNVKESYYSIENARADDFKLMKLWIKSVYGGLIFLTLSMLIPTHESIIRLKIAKFKNEMLTSANVNTSLERINQIAEKLECKYLGCNKDNK